MTVLDLERVSFSYLNGLVVKDFNLSVQKGEMMCLLGPNGSGKTTLLKLISGILRPTQGTVYLEGRDIRSLRRREIARRIAVVPQQFHIPFAFTVREVVALGRVPFWRRFSEGGAEEQVMISRILEIMNLRHLEQRFFTDLSGGERQKVILAMALAQQPRLLLLDEPTAHLDISHQIEIMEMVKGLNQEQGITVVAALHDLNLASLYFPRLVLLKEGYLFAQGTAAEIFTPELIQQVFSASVQVERHPQSGAPYIVLLP